MGVVCVIRAMQVVAQEQAAAAAAAAVKREAHKQRQVTKVLEASKLRSERASRVSKLKVQLMSSLCIQHYLKKHKSDLCWSSQRVGVFYHTRDAFLFANQLLRPQNYLLPICNTDP